MRLRLGAGHEIHGRKPSRGGGKETAPAAMVKGGCLPFSVEGERKFHSAKRKEEEGSLPACLFRNVSHGGKRGMPL